MAFLLFHQFYKIPEKLLNFPYSVSLVNILYIDRRCLLPFFFFFFAGSASETVLGRGQTRSNVTKLSLAVSGSMSFCFVELRTNLGSSVDERQCRKLVSERRLVRTVPGAQLVAPSS